MFDQAGLSSFSEKLFRDIPQNFPLIIIDDHPEREAKMLSLGAWDFICKPMHCDALQLRLQRAVSFYKKQDVPLGHSDAFAYLEHMPIAFFAVRFFHTSASESDRLKIQYINPAFSHFCSISKDQLLHMPLDVLPDFSVFMDVFFEIAKNGGRQTLLADGLFGMNKKFSLYCYQPTFGLCACVIRDISDRYRLEQQHWYLNRFDPLTGLYNTAAFYKRVTELLSRQPNQVFVMICLDIGRFKTINEMYGTNIGDQLLRHIASVLRMLCGYSESNAYCRMSADIFFIFRAYDRVELPLFLTQLDQMTASFLPSSEIISYHGLYIIEDSSMSVDYMCDRARLALSTVKGKYTVRTAYYDSKLHQGFIHEQQVLNRMTAALSAGEFMIYLQPKFFLKTCALSGAEALVRWVDPVRGIVSPAEFIPIFEKNGFIMKLDCYVWQQTCKVIHRWMQEGRHFPPISINISKIDLYHPRLYHILIGLINKYNIPPKMLPLELTESAYTENTSSAFQIIERLRESGFTIMMDDFGSGYSSLNMLKEAPVDALKIDLRFLSDEHLNGKSGDILSSIMQMANRIQLNVIAEGIETQQQADFLNSIGCPEGQGYLFSRPLPVAKFEALLK